VATSLNVLHYVSGRKQEIRIPKFLS